MNLYNIYPLLLQKCLKNGFPLMDAKCQDYKDSKSYTMRPIKFKYINVVIIVQHTIQMLSMPKDFWMIM